MAINKDFLYPRTFYDYGNSNKYFNYQKDNLVTFTQSGIHTVIWYKDKPLTKKQLSKSKLSLAEIEKTFSQFDDDFTWTRLGKKSVKVSGCITGAAIFFNGKVRRRLSEELGTHCIIAYDDNSLWAMSIDSHDSDWITKAFTASDVSQASGKCLWISTETGYKIIVR